MLLVLTFFIPYFAVLKFSDSDTQNGKNNEENFKTVSVYVAAEDSVRKMDMSQYLKETVAAEMPAEFEKEALKAQAVAARTYLVNRINAKNEDAKKAHKGGDICTDHTHCKAWVSEDERKKSWPEEKRDEYWQKISSAVEETAGILITYNDTPISAVFHSTSSGFTEDAKDVWGSEVPYLLSVESQGEEKSPRYRSDARFSLDEFKSIAEANIKDINWEKGLIGDITRSDAGGIKTITIGGVSIKGTEFRTMYSLRSTNAEIVTEGDSVSISVTGNGHGVGMSQYGANYLASCGKNYEEILKTYYTGVEIE